MLYSQAVLRSCHTEVGTILEAFRTFATPERNGNGMMTSLGKIRMGRELDALCSECCGNGMNSVFMRAVSFFSKHLWADGATLEQSQHVALETASIIPLK